MPGGCLLLLLVGQLLVSPVTFPKIRLTLARQIRSLRRMKIPAAKQSSLLRIIFIFESNVRPTASSSLEFHAPAVAPPALATSESMFTLLTVILWKERNGRKTLTTVQGLPKKFDQKKILKVIKKKFACNGTIVNDTEMGEVIQLQGDQRKDVQEFLCDKKEGLGMDAKSIKVSD
jgi:translation initiation factor SUI1